MDSPAETHAWTAEEDAKLLLGIMHLGQPKIKIADLCQLIQTRRTPKAISHRMSHLKKEAEKLAQEANFTADDGSTTPKAKAPAKKRTPKTPGNANDEENLGTPTPKRKRSAKKATTTTAAAASENSDADKENNDGVAGETVEAVEDDIDSPSKKSKN